MSKTKLNQNPYFTTCHVCNGDTYLSNPEWQEYWKKWDEVEQSLKTQDKSPSIDEVESFLESQSIFKPDSPQEYVCPDCDGSGIEPTEAGKQILEFLELFGFITKYDL